MQWGTPQDFNEFKIWCNYFLESKLQNTNSKINCVNYFQWLDLVKDLQIQVLTPLNLF